MKEADFEELKQKYPALAQHFHWVGPGGHIQAGYYRRIPRTYYDRRALSPAELRRRIAFSEIAQRSFGQKGFREGVPVVAHNIKKRISGQRFREPTLVKALRELRESLKEMAEIVAVTET